jgi:hypothetical protein
MVVMLAAAGALAALYLVVHGVPGRAGSGQAAPGGTGSGAGGGSPAGPGTGKSVLPPTPSDAPYAELRKLAADPKPENLPKFREALASSDPQTQVLAIDGIGSLRDSGDANALTAVVADSSRQEEVRAHAIAWLGRLRCVPAGSVVIAALDDPSLAVRTRASRAIRSILGADFGYRASDPPDKRRQAIDKIRQIWPLYYQKTMQPR